VCAEVAISDLRGALSASASARAFIERMGIMNKILFILIALALQVQLLFVYGFHNEVTKQNSHIINFHRIVLEQFEILEPLL